jgi:hypothetical protein
MTASQEIDLQAMCERVSRLERQNRTMKRLGTSVLVLAAAALLVGQAPAKPKPSGGRTIEAETFVVVARNGEPAAKLGVFSGGPGLILLDEKGVSRGNLSLSKSGPGLSLSDENGKPRIALTSTEDGGRLTIADEKGRILVAMTVSRSGSNLVLRDTNDEIRWEVP